MNVVYSSSDSYAPIAGVSICSLLKNNTDADEINIYMIDNNISAENKQRFENLANEYKRNIIFIPQPDLNKQAGVDIEPDAPNSIAKNIIIKYGLYVPEPKMRHYDKNRNTDKNLAETLDLHALSDYAYRTNYYEDNIYIGLANAISRIVFNRDLESIRIYYDMLYEDYVSDYITDYEYDMIAYCCKIATYLLKYSDISIEGMEIFIKLALDNAMEEFDNKSYINRSNFGESQAINNIFDKAMNNVDYNEYEEPQRKLEKRKHLSDEEIEEFKRYL